MAMTRAERFQKHFHSIDYVQFVGGLPCMKCQRGPCEVHHDPTKASGGDWQTTSPLCFRCHSERHTKGVVTFWASVGITYQEANERTQALWQAHTRSL